MDTPTLKQILQEEMALFAGKGLNAMSYFMFNEEAQVYAVIDYASIKGQKFVDAPLVAHLADDIIYIDVDNNYPTLFQSLKARGVPENQIVLAYRQDTIEA
jgi:hypothetical protein